MLETDALLHADEICYLFRQSKNVRHHVCVHTDCKTVCLHFSIYGVILAIFFTFLQQKQNPQHLTGFYNQNTQNLTADTMYIETLRFRVEILLIMFLFIIYV